MNSVLTMLGPLFRLTLGCQGGGKLQFDTDVFTLFCIIKPFIIDLV